jgi:hypothetical protein
MSKAPIRNLIIEQGTDWEEVFQIKDELGAVIDLTGYTFAGQARRVADPTATLVLTFTFTVDLGTNKVTVSVAKATTSAITVGPTETHPDSKFYYDYEATVAGKRRRIQQGTLVIYRELTV